MTTATKPNLEHKATCNKPRQFDKTTHPEHNMTTLHCVDCGAHQAFNASGEPVAAPTDAGPFYSAEPQPGVFDGITIDRAEGNR